MKQISKYAVSSLALLLSVTNIFAQVPHDTHAKHNKHTQHNEYQPHSEYQPQDEQNQHDRCTHTKQNPTKPHTCKHHNECANQNQPHQHGPKTSAHLPHAPHTKNNESAQQSESKYKNEDLRPSSDVQNPLDDLPLLPWGTAAITGTGIGWFLGSSTLASMAIKGITSGKPEALIPAVATVLTTYYAAQKAKEIRGNLTPQKFNTPKIASQCLAIAALSGLWATYKNYKTA